MLIKNQLLSCKLLSGLKSLCSSLIQSQIANNKLMSNILYCVFFLFLLKYKNMHFYVFIPKYMFLHYDL